jgi:hypothetical protein
MSLEQDVPHPPGTNSVAFHRKQFLAERIGWIAMALLLVWAIAGGFGDGWLSNKSASNQAETLAVEYQRFARRESPVNLRIRLSEASSTGEIVLHLNREFADRVKLERITPRCRAMTADAAGLHLAFDRESAAHDCLLTIEYRPRRIGPLHISIRAKDQDTAAFDQFIYP